MPLTIYGIKNCETMKKARAWLDKRSVDYSFHGYKTAGTHVFAVIPGR
jgi:arsenate reductase-like glutaredoxin family protein